MTGNTYSTTPTPTLTVVQTAVDRLPRKLLLLHRQAAAAIRHSKPEEKEVVDLLHNIQTTALFYCQWRPARKRNLLALSVTKNERPAPEVTPAENLQIERWCENSSDTGSWPGK